MVVALIGSVLLVSIGIVGEYLGRVFEEAKDRPLYLVASTFHVDVPRGVRSPHGEIAKPIPLGSAGGRDAGL